MKIAICTDFGEIQSEQMEKMLAVMTKFRNVCAHGERLFDYRTKDALRDMPIHERMKIHKTSGRYDNGKNDLFAQVIILKLLLNEADFKKFYHALKAIIVRNSISDMAMEHMGFPTDWQRIGRIKKFVKNSVKPR